VKRKSHYAILGIPRRESRAGIRAAYLRRVKALHPDHAGEASTPAFREVQQAYDVLSDPERRRRYDDQLDHKRPARIWQTEPLTRHQPVEPLVGDQPLAARGRTVASTFVDELVHRFFADVTPIGGSPRPSQEVVGLDVTMSVEQAARGGDFTVGVPIRETCRVCAGTGVSWPFSCVVCAQQGWVEGEHLLRLNVPPGIRHGTVVHLQLEKAGGVTLRIRLLIDRRMRAPPIW
jgi:DnaJ-class molecular chaperone